MFPFSNVDFLRIYLTPGFVVVLYILLSLPVINDVSLPTSITAVGFVETLNSSSFEIKRYSCSYIV